jgi:hypothetical protein
MVYKFENNIEKEVIITRNANEGTRCQSGINFNLELIKSIRYFQHPLGKVSTDSFNERNTSLIVLVIGNDTCAISWDYYRGPPDFRIYLNTDKYIDDYNYLFEFPLPEVVVPSAV